MSDDQILPTQADAAALNYLNGDDPVPNPEMLDIGDGDFRAIGSSFLRHFVRLGGLTPDERVFEIGCGVGRMALPLQWYLSPEGRYHGMDVVAPGIDWCRSRITARDPRFEFSHQDLYHPLYNPNGIDTATNARLPAENSSVDFVIATSVFTHLARPVLDRYVDEVARILSPGGRVFATFFLINGAARDGLAAKTSRYAFDLSDPGPMFRAADDGGLLRSIAVDENWVLQRALDSGLQLAAPVAYGFWPTGDPERGADYQDICIFHR